VSERRRPPRRRAADGGQGSAAGLDGEGGDGAGGIVRDVEEVAAGSVFSEVGSSPTAKGEPVIWVKPPPLSITYTDTVLSVLLAT